MNFVKYLLLLLLLVSYTPPVYAKPHVYDIERKKYYNSHYYKKHVRHHKRKDVVKDVIVPLTAVILLNDILTREKKKDCKVTKVKVVDKDGKVVDEYKEVRCEK